MVKSYELRENALPANEVPEHANLNVDVQDKLLFCKILTPVNDTFEDVLARLKMKFEEVVEIAHEVIGHITYSAGSLLVSKITSSVGLT
jgi:hypothetical protein